MSLPLLQHELKLAEELLEKYQESGNDSAAYRVNRRIIALKNLIKQEAKQ